MTLEKPLRPKSIIEFKLGRKRYHFSPRPLATLAAVVVFPLLLLLGFWQLHRADIKREILATYQTNSHAAPAGTLTTLTEPLPLQFQRISVKGHFVNSQQILLDNRFNEHKAGYEVLTPFKLTNSNAYLLVNRGWIQRGRNRTIMPIFETPDDKEIVTLSGYVNYPKQRNLLLGPNLEAPKQGLSIAQNIQLDQISDTLQHPVYPLILLLDEESEHGFSRHWNPVTMTPDIHMGYAVQWFALAASLLIIYIVVNLKSEKLRD
jgi:surfeit locus 1 family protein